MQLVVTGDMDKDEREKLARVIAMSLFRFGISDCVESDELATRVNFPASAHMTARARYNNPRVQQQLKQVFEKYGVAITLLDSEETTQK